MSPFEQSTRHSEAGMLARAFHLDWLLIFATLGTITMSVLMIHSTEPVTGAGFFARQATAGAVGLVAMMFLALLPYQVFRMYVKLLYVVMVIFLIAVLFFGVTLRGTRGWFHLGPIYLQASEVAKFLFVLSVSGLLDRRIQWYSPQALIPPLAAAMFPILLIVIEPDLSSSLVFFPMTLVMFYVAGARTLHLLAISLVGGLASVIPLVSTYMDLVGPSLKGHTVLLFLARALKGGWDGLWLFVGFCSLLIIIWWFLRQFRIYIPSLYLWVTLTLIGVGTLGAIGADRALKVYQRKRLIAFVNPNLDPLGGGYNVRQSQIAIGSGRVLGKGYGQGTQSRLGFLPSRHTDFIFSVVGEELGFLRSLVMLGLYFLIVWRGFEISLVARDRFGSLVAAGIAAMFAFYALLNLGMTMGLAPVAGVPLPLMSYGGSSVVSSMMAVGLLLSIHWRRHLLDKD